MAKRKKGDPVHGWVNIDKPVGMTSTQVIGKLRRFLNPQKIGHAGTLDPLATGVLPIALGEATKTIPYAQDAIKIYRFTVSWGEARDTDDSEGDIIETSDIRPTKQAIEDILPEFIGDIEQTPPLYSAIKIDGQRAYDLARAGKRPEIKSRRIFVENLTLKESRAGDADFEVTCGKGTYVRSLARDMAEKLGTKGHISALRRIKVGSFEAQNAISLDNLSDLDYVAARAKALLPLEYVLDDIPALTLTEEETSKLRQGQGLSFVSRPNFTRLTEAGLGTKDVQTALAIFQKTPVGLIENVRAEIKPVRLFNI